ncbi:MAG: hypothetical protein ABFR97_08095 [Thermodesulfobacteriota bacterium]
MTLVTLILTSGLSLAAGPIVKEVKVYSGSKKNAYSLFFPIEIKEPGQISLAVSVLGQKPEKDRCEIALVDSGVFWKNLSDHDWQRWLKGEFTPPMRGRVSGKTLKKRRHGMIYGKRSGRVVHNVDAPELGRYSGRYVVMIVNRGKHQGQHRLVMNLPGQEEERGSRSSRGQGQSRQQASTNKRCDLAVQAIGPNRDGQVVVTVINKGPGGVPARAYELQGKDAVTLMLSRNGKSWGGATLSKFDPQRRLRKPGARVRYTSNLIVSSSITVSATVDGSRKIKERDERNNTLSKKF